MIFFGFVMLLNVHLDVLAIPHLLTKNWGNNYKRFNVNMPNFTLSSGCRPRFMKIN